jgi:hypothetical protein
MYALAEDLVLIILIGLFGSVLFLLSVGGIAAVQVFAKLRINAHTSTMCTSGSAACEYNTPPARQNLLIGPKSALPIRR